VKPHATADTPTGREQHLASALDLATDALVTLDAHGVVEHLNGAAERLLGVERASVLGRRIDEFFEDAMGGVHTMESLSEGLARRNTTEGLLKPRLGSNLLRFTLHVAPGADGGTLRLTRTRSAKIDGVAALLRPVIHDSREDERTEVDSDDRFLDALDGVMSGLDEAAAIFNAVAVHLGSHLPLDRCLFVTISVERNELVVHPGHERNGPTLVGLRQLSSLGEPTRTWLIEGRIVVTSDALTDPRTRSRYESAYAPAGVRASVVVPLMHLGTCRGYLSLSSSTPRNWTARELALSHAVASRTIHFIEGRRTLRTQEALVEGLRSANTELEARVEARTAELTVALADREALLEERDRAAEQLRRTIEASPTGMLMVSLDGRIAAVNAKTEAIFGYQRGELVGQPIELLMGRALDVRPVDPVAEPAGSQSESVDVEGIRKDGSNFPVHLAVNPLETAEGRFVLASVSDVTDRVLSERALRENEARYRRLFHDSPTALCEQDLSQVKAYLDELSAGGVTDVCAYLRGHPLAVASAARRVRFIEVNDATLEMYEAESRSEILENWHKLFDQDMLKVFVEELCFLVEGKGTLFSARTSTRTLKGNRNEIVFRLSVLPGSERTWDRLVASIFDMTAYHEAERKLHAALREKDVLLKEVHHRVKNNLQVISSLLSLQAQYVPDASTRAVFASSQGRVQSIALVHEKLYQSRNLSHIKLSEYLKTLISDLLSANSAAERGIKSVLDIADLSLTVDVAIPCGLIVNELVSNALKHAFSARPSGTVTVRAVRQNEELIELSVADDGLGLPQVIDPHASSSLGLDLVFTFAEQLGAEVEIVRDGGTTFVFRFREEAA
jgi:PAS domain S-box-containing protein